MLDLINKYKKELQQQIKQLELNEQIMELFLYFDTKEMFLSLDINEYINLLRKIKYSDEDIKILKNNILYVQSFINNLDDEDYNNHINIIKEKLSNLNTLVIEVPNDIKTNLESLNNLLLLFNNNKYIEDIDIIFKIFEHFSIPFKDIKPYIKDIIEHNKGVNLELPKDNKFEEFIKLYDFNEIEKEILTNYYKNNKVGWEQKYNYLTNTKEYKYVMSDINKNKKLFIILMVLSNIDIMNNVIKLCNERNIKIKKMLPNIFVLRNKKFISNEDEFYSIFEGSYEDFISNLNFLPKDLDLSKVEPTYYISNANLIRENYQILLDYNIPLDINSTICLTIENLKDKLDKIIECGLYSYFKDNPKKILEIKNDLFFYRIKYAKDNNLEYKRKYLSKELFLENGFGINEENLQEAYKIPLFEKEEFQNCKNIKLENIINISILNLFDNKFLQEDKVSYKIGEFIISKNKVKLLLNKYLLTIKEKTNKTLIIGLLYSILDGMILNQSETMWLVNYVIESIKELLPNELTDEEFDDIVNLLFDEQIIKGGK